MSTETKNETKKSNWAEADEMDTPLTPTGNGGSDPLDINCKDIDTGFPVLVPGLYDFSLKATVEPNKDKSGKNLVIKHITTRETKSTDGQTQVAGQIHLTKWIPVTPKHNPGKSPYDNAAIARAIANVAQACNPPLDASPRQIIETPSLLDGKIVRAKVTVRPEREDKETGRTFSEDNEIAKYIPIS